MMTTHTFRFGEFQADIVESGKKRCAIRAPRKRAVCPGDTLRLTGPIWAGRGKLAAEPARLLRVAPCVGVHAIELRFHRRTDAVISADITGEPFDAPTCVDPKRAQRADRAAQAR